MFLQMSPLHFKNKPFQDLELVQLTPVNFFRHKFSIFSLLHFFKVHNEVLKSVNDMFTVDVGSINDSNLITHH